MARSWHHQHVARYLEEPKPNYGFSESIENHETESHDHFNYEESSYQGSVFPAPSANALRRNAKSFDNLREALQQRNYSQMPPSPNPIYPFDPVEIASEFGDRTEATPTGVEKFCGNCLGMTAENMAQPGGYKHSMLSEFFKSMEWCSLCDLMESQLRLSASMDCTPDRYQIVVSFQGIGDDDEARPDATHPRRPRSPTGHGNNRDFFENNFSPLWLQVMDLSPWEPPEDYKQMSYYAMSETPEDFLKPAGSKPISIRGRPMICFTEEFDPATSFGVEYVRQIGRNTSSTRSFQIAGGWLASCLSAESQPKLHSWVPHDIAHNRRQPYHGHEAGDAQAIALENDAVSLPAQDPLRLVEIRPVMKGSAPTIRVIHTDGHRYQYAALSYCWGKAQPGDSRPWQTRHATLKSHLEGINRQHLPQTLQDAIFICESLNISYLWVDSLCIIQDSPSDWAAEAAKMSGIYLGSLLTISLSASISAESGCFNNVSQRIVESENFGWITIDTRLRDGRSSRLYITALTSASKLFENEVRDGVLAQRAWVLQEHILPKRTLYITSKQLLWECGHCRLSEDNFPQQQTDRLYPICDYDFPLDAEAIIEMWYKRVVEDYTRRQLTYEKDKLVAISALARATFLNRHTGYVAGLWRDCIVPGLLWRRSGPGHKSRTYSCPSWSWASQNSAVRYDYAIPSNFTPRPSESFPRVENVSWDTMPDNPFGDVLFAYVDLDTTITLGTVLRDNTFNDLFYPYKDDYEQQTVIIPGPGPNGTLCVGAAMDDADGGGRNVAVANMGHCLLLLEPPSLNSKEYHRIGIVLFNLVNHNLDHRLVNMDDISRGWTQRTIRLV